MIRKLAFALAAVAAVLMGTEILLQYRSAMKEAFTPPVERAPRHNALSLAYDPFIVQHLHPQYLFFFPLTPADRVALANTVCSIDADGFREPGPAHANGRKLAVILGGSAAFGYGASSNASTITAYLNGLQQEYFFVNAGVPSWNSTQELYRLLLEIVDRHPKLIVAYDGYNDAVLSGLANLSSRKRYPAGTPHQFIRLDDLVDGVTRAPSAWNPLRYFPELRHRIDKYRGATTAPVMSHAPPDVEAAAALYLANQARMASIAQSAGARFISIFQPIPSLHRNVDPAFDPPEDGAAIEAFHAAVRRAPPPAYEFHDLSSVFDRDFDRIPVPAPDITPDTVFFDSAHLHDRGNQIMAQHLWKLMQPGTDAPAR